MAGHNKKELERGEENGRTRREEGEQMKKNEEIRKNEKKKRTK